MSNITFLWGKLIPLEIGKDVLLLPCYLGKSIGCQVDIVCEWTEGVEALLSKDRFIDGRLNIVNRNMGNSRYSILLSHLKYLLLHAQKIDVLICFHWTLSTILKIILYKYLNREGKIYLKLDSNLGSEFILKKNSLYSYIRRLLYNKAIKEANVISCETSQTFEILCADSLWGKKLRMKLVLVPNGFDEEKFKSYHISEKFFPSKENLMITVSRLGTPPKNTGMILRALERVDLKSWKFCLIGPVEKEFQREIDLFYQNNPIKKENVEFVGNISDKRELWEWYNRAKVFVFTSRWESYGLVLNEAKRFRNYLLSTNVGAFNDLSENGKYGQSVNQDDDRMLADLIQDIVDGEKDVNVYRDDFLPDSLSYLQQVKKILPFIQ